MKVLVVEDNELIRSNLVKGLEEAGYAVDAASDGDEGFWYAEGCMYDVIVLDLMLPGMDGITILKKLRKKGRKDPVLILTARGDVPDRVEGLDSGADDYLCKPFSFEELLARVRALIRRRYEDSNPVLETAGLRIDTAAQKVFRGDTEIALTAREYSLLEYLAHRSGELVSRTDIWDHLYAFDSNSMSNVVDVYIGYLRRKLDVPGEKSIIETVRGRGYRLGAAP